MMQTTAGEIFEFLKLMAPLELQMDFDNAGFLVGDRGRRVEKALLALDATSEVIDEAIDFGADMIITHHPLIWNAMKSLTTDDIMQRRVMKLVKNDISLISMHTNLDIADGGVNDVLLSLLGADLICALDEDGCGRVGQLREPTDMAHFLPFCKAMLRTNGLRWLGDRYRRGHRGLLCGAVRRDRRRAARAYLCGAGAAFCYDGGRPLSVPVRGRSLSADTHARRGRAVRYLRRAPAFL